MASITQRRVVKSARTGDDYKVKAVKGWVADTNNDGTHSIADVQSGDTVLVFTKRRFIDQAAKTVSAAFVIDGARRQLRSPLSGDPLHLGD